MRFKVVYELIASNELLTAKGRQACPVVSECLRVMLSVRFSTLRVSDQISS